MVDNTQRVADRIAHLECRREVARSYDDGTMSGYLTAKAFTERIDKEIAKLSAGDTMNCICCSDLVDGQVAGDTYWCQHCNLPLCRKWECISVHTAACEVERRAIVGDEVVDRENKRTHYDAQELRDIAARGRELNQLKRDF